MAAHSTRCRIHERPWAATVPSAARGLLLALTKTGYRRAGLARPRGFLLAVRKTYVGRQCRPRAGEFLFAPTKTRYRPAAPPARAGILNGADEDLVKAQDPPLK
jgi:hypothetical protein